MADKNKTGKDSQTNKGKTSASGNSQNVNKPEAPAVQPVVQETNEAGVTRSYDGTTGKYNVEGVDTTKDGTQITQQREEEEKKRIQEEEAANAENAATTPASEDKGPVDPGTGVPLSERSSIVTEEDEVKEAQAEEAKLTPFDLGVKKLYTIFEQDKNRVNALNRVSVRRLIDQVPEIGGFTIQDNPENPAEAAIILMSPECAEEFGKEGKSDKPCYRLPEEGWYNIGIDPSKPAVPPAAK